MRILGSNPRLNHHTVATIRKSQKNRNLSHLMLYTLKSGSIRISVVYFLAQLLG